MRDDEPPPPDPNRDPIRAVSRLEIQFVAEIDRLEAQVERLTKTLRHDVRFVLDEPPLVGSTERALLRGAPLRTVDRLLLERYSLVAQPPR